MGSLLQDVIGLFSKKKYAENPYEVSKDDFLVLSTRGSSELNVMAYLPKVDQTLISVKQLADAINGAGNTTYDYLLANDGNNNSILSLEGSDGTTDNITIKSGNGISQAIDLVAGTVTLSVSTGTFVECTGSNTANVIPMWDGGTCSLKDSDFTFDGNNQYALDASKKFSLGWLRMNNANAIIEVSNGTGAVGQVLTVASGGVLKWSTNGTGSMSSWKIAGDVGASQIITDGDEVTFGGGQKIVTEVQGTQVLKITHDNTTRTDTTSTVTPGPGVQFSVIDDVQTDSMGHITDVNTKQVTMPTISGVTSVSTLTAGTISIGGTAQDPTVSTITTGVSDGGTGLATGDQIYDFVIGLGYGIVDSVTGGDGIKVTGTAQDPVVNIKYNGVDNAILVAPTEVAVADDFLWFSDATNDNIRKVKIGDLPISGGGGGVTQIVAGTNVNISPANGVGTVTINSTDQYLGTVTSVGTSNSTFIDVTGGTITNTGTITAALSASGTPDASKYLRGDNTWSPIPTDTNTTYDLSSAQAGSDVNVNLVASNPASTDTVKLVAGSNVTLTDNGSSEITIAAAGSVTNVNATTGGDALDVSGVPITSTGTMAFTWAGSASEYVNGEGDLVTFPSFQAPLTLTTTGTSGAATLVGNTLNIPQYAGGSSTDEKFKIDSADTAAGYFTDKVTIGSGLSGSVNTDGSGVKTLTISAVSFPYVSSIKVGSNTDSGAFEFTGPGVTMVTGTPTEIEFASVVTLAATTAGDALDVAVTNNSTTTGISTAAFTWAGSGSQYVDGQGNLKTFPSIPAAFTFNVEGDTGSPYTVPSGGTVDVAGGTGISTANASGVITVGLDNTGVTPGVYTNADITVNAQGQITVAANGSSGGGMTSWTAQGDSGTDQVITNGDKLLFKGDGTIETVAQATDEILINHASSGVTAGTYNFASIQVDAKGHVVSASSGSAVNTLNLQAGTSTGSALTGNITGTTLTLQPNVFAGSANVGFVPSSSGVDQNKFFLRADGTWAQPGSTGSITAGCGIDVTGSQISVEYGQGATNVVNCANLLPEENFDIDNDTMLVDDKDSGGAGVHEAKEIKVKDVFDRAVQRSTFPLPVAWGKVVTGTSGFASPANAGRSNLGPMSYTAVSSSSGTLSWANALAGTNYVIQLTCDSILQPVHCYARNKQTQSVIIGTKTMAGADLAGQELDYVIYDTSMNSI